MNPFSLYRAIRKKGVLGINARNIDYIQKYNSRRFFPRADSKILCKQIAMDAGIPVPALYDIVSSVGQFRTFIKEVERWNDFVVKPEHGAGGEGVLVLERSSDGVLTLPSGAVFSLEDLRIHLANIISGLYSLGGQPDRAVVEYRVQFDPVFEEISYRGVPDIRIIIFLGVPVMAMLRLPTKKSSGRANLHQGAIGVGVDLNTGITEGGVMGFLPISLHPDTQKSITGVQIPHWEEMLRIACRSYELFELGYLGIDIVIDRNIGPLVLEVNVRPGLSIQLANSKGLASRLKMVSRHKSQLSTIDERLAFVREELAKIQ